MSSFNTRLTTENDYVKNSNEIVQELYDCLDKNVWYEYLQLIHKANEMHGKNWIDFEGEIREVIEFFDREINDLYEQLATSLTSPQSVPIKIACFSKRLNFSECNEKIKREILIKT